MLDRIIQKFGLHVVNTDEVEDSFSSTVYKLALSNGENVYVKIPYSKLKYDLVKFHKLLAPVHISALNKEFLHRHSPNLRVQVYKRSN